VHEQDCFCNRNLFVDQFIELSCGRRPKIIRGDISTISHLLHRQALPGRMRKTHARTMSAFGQMPLSFETNVGQPR